MANMPIKVELRRNGDAQTVEIPAALGFADHVRAVRIWREGTRVSMVAHYDGDDEFLALFGSCPDFPDPPKRETPEQVRTRWLAELEEPDEATPASPRSMPEK